MEIISVFSIKSQKKNELKKLTKCLKPMKLDVTISPMDMNGVTSLNAIMMPIIGTYLKMIKYPATGRNSR